MALSQVRGWHVALLLDEDPCHTAKASLRTAEGMTLLWLPNRSPKLDPMDTLWGQGKDVISATSTSRWIVLSKRFWLRAAFSH